MRTLFTFSAFVFLLLLNSCKKDYTCVCESIIYTDAIYYNNKVETEPTTSSTYDYETMNGQEKTVKKECNQYATHTEANGSLPEGRTGGSITHTTTCSVQ